ncbi:uncharacterized protein LOC18423122 isoform X2 [Amborella trichopoda]|uniref:uncharacterized protein LOC18423122 isoform X2 n=1 Tax=Amborella trichopoda TaxID=13333 RepID=UPI0005D440D8|nr:uncharacterized protein LOC18423122 isoform X2 [Amborella trichopoda]|eukprot:XP_011625630.1 uncharacterized protein LOC18423122 isoform X2 [Amborella trichopoda]
MAEGRGSLMLLIIVLVFDLIAFGLAVVAEQRRSTAQVLPDRDKEYTYCVYDSDIATGYGVGAFLFLFISQILVMAASKCFCCGRSLRPGGSRAWALVLFIACWLKSKPPRMQSYSAETQVFETIKDESFQTHIDEDVSCLCACGHTRLVHWHVRFSSPKCTRHTHMFVVTQYVCPTA